MKIGGGSKTNAITTICISFKQQKILKPIPPLLIHPRDRLPQPASPVTSENSGRFFITRDEFNLKVNQIGDDLEKIKELHCFVGLIIKN